MPWDQTTHPKISMPMTAASVAQRGMGLKASIWNNEGVPSALVSQRIQQGTMAVHGFRNHTGKTSDAHQGRARGGDQAPQAAIARVSAAKSVTWSLVLCLRM